MPKYLDGAGLSRFWNNIKGSIGSASQEQVDAWLDNHPEATTTVQDNSVTNKKLVQAGGILSDVENLGNITYAYRELLTPSAASSGWALTGEGPCVADSSSKIVKYQVTAGDRLYLRLSADNAGVYQWQNNVIVPSNNNQYVVGDPVTTAVNGVVAVPDGATYLIVSQLNTNTSNLVQSARPQLVNPLMRNGSIGNPANASAVAMSYVQPILDAEAVRINANIDLQDGQSFWWVVETFSSHGQPSQGTAITYTEPYYHGTNSYIEVVNDGTFAGFAAALWVKDSSDNNVPLRVENVGNCLTCEYFFVSDSLHDISGTIVKPRMNDGTIQDVANASCINTPMSVSTQGASAVLFTYEDEVPSGQTVSWMPITCSSVGLNRPGMVGAAIRKYDGSSSSPLLLGKEFLFELQEGENAIGVSLGLVYESDPHSFVSGGLRITKSQSCVTMRFLYEPNDSHSEVASMLKNARHISHAVDATIANPLTLLHFSDIHADQYALKRIMAGFDSTLMDDAICTGDMAANTAGQISGWWNSSVMTCIGNHDTASYNSATGYNWTALSMANRDAYYIAPFESGWGVTHTSGTSYYYKDYTSSNVRLIVMDGMLYMSDSYASEASAQTSWLTSLLSGAITAGLHVLIAIHAPHAGATAKQCSFTKLQQGPMPSNIDCDTPQTVINAVATAITNGLDFIGYIVGHTHQDNIWDATGDGSQLMYCVTCAAVTQTAQWQDSDQSRDRTMDAYNLITIDTNNKLVKLVRGGGANVDNKMRPRKMLCINYGNGSIIGQEL